MSNKSFELDIYIMVLNIDISDSFRKIIKKEKQKMNYKYLESCLVWPNKKGSMFLFMKM